MNRTSRYQLKNNTVLITANGYRGEDDFYAMYDLIKEIVQPDSITFGVDSMCVDGSFRKDNILIRISSESAFDFCCFLYDAGSLNDAQLAKAEDWITQVTDRLNETRIPHFDTEEEEY